MDRVMNDQIPDPTTIGCIMLAALLIKSFFELCKMTATISLCPLLLGCPWVYSNLSAVLALFSGSPTLVLPLLRQPSVQ
jgi:hypothetical protein